MQFQSGDIFVEVYECEGDLTLVGLDGQRPAQIGRRYKYCGWLLWRDGKADMKIANEESIEHMYRAIMPFVHYAAEKLLWRTGYAA